MENRRIGRFLSLVLSVVIAFGMVSASAFSASAVQSRSFDFDDMEDFVGSEPEIEFSAKDANILKRVVAGDIAFIKGTEEFNKYDVDEDGVLSAKDANIIKRVIAGATVL